MYHFIWTSRKENFLIPCQQCLQATNKKVSSDVDILTINCKKKGLFLYKIDVYCLLRCERWSNHPNFEKERTKNSILDIVNDKVNAETHSNRSTDFSTKTSSDSSCDCPNIVVGNPKAICYDTLCQIRTLIWSVNNHAIIFIWHSKSCLCLHVEVILWSEFNLSIRIAAVNTQ